MDRWCALCPGVNHCIPPDGPKDADILFIGEAPGKQENNARPPRVFIGKTGDEVNQHYLPLAGLRRDRVLFTNSIRCLPISTGGKLDPNRRADRDLLEACANHHLYPLVGSRRFKLLVPMGAFAIRAICPDVSLDLHHGFPVPTRWGIPAFPMFHPALGIHEPKRMLHIRTDWDRLRRYLRGVLRVPQDDYPEPDYQEVTDVAEILSLPRTADLAIDTESRRGGEPFCLTYAEAGGVGRLVRADRRDLVSALQTTLGRWNGRLLFHNLLYDWRVCQRMELRLPYRRVVDTMALVFHLGNLPQGLKALALRELGMTMQDFDDLVTPYSLRLVLDYYHLAQLETWPKPDPELIQDEKTGMWKLYKPQSMNTKLKRFFTDFSKNPDKDPFAMWEENWTDSHEMIEERLGPWPGKCISHVPFEKVLYYACRDADATLRLWQVLRRMARFVRRYSQEHWRERAA